MIDLLVLLAIVVLGAFGAFEAGVWAMPAGASGRGPQASGLTPAIAAVGASDSPASTPSGGAAAASASPGGAAPSASASTLSPGATPWTAWKPTAPGTITRFQLPGPWAGGARNPIPVTVYLPGGYARSGRAYPVIYEAPFSYRSWDKWIGVKALLDAEMSSGSTPASIVVFAHPARGPYVDTECVNSADGREQVETFYSSTLVQAIDARFRTVPNAAARSVLGFSQGGYCAAMLVLRHPDVFSTALAISGYYVAGVHDAQTPNAWRVFAGNAALEVAYSPLRLVAHLSPTQRAAVLLVLQADPVQRFYGPQYAAMLAAAHGARVPVVAQPLPIPHSWVAVRAALPGMLRALAAHEVALGVFG
ncbi:MAG TPA: alpha/beta hydrolase-fold protein [Candidatus Limnocylindrales bacterium]